MIASQCANTAYVAALSLLFQWMAAALNTPFIVGVEKRVASESQMFSVVPQPLKLRGQVSQRYWPCIAPWGAKRVAVNLLLPTRHPVPLGMLAPEVPPFLDPLVVALQAGSQSCRE